MGKPRYDKKGKYAVEVMADNTGTWAGNALTFDTVQDAETYVRDLALRWRAVRDWKVIDRETNREVGGLCC